MERRVQSEHLSVVLRLLLHDELGTLQDSANMSVLRIVVVNSQDTMFSGFVQEETSREMTKLGKLLSTSRDFLKLMNA